jgi:hypothetical protein
MAGIALTSQVLEVDEEGFIPAMVNFVVGYRCWVATTFGADRVLAQDRCPQSGQWMFPSRPVVEVLPIRIGVLLIGSVASWFGRQVAHTLRFYVHADAETQRAALAHIQPLQK